MEQLPIETTTYSMSANAPAELDRRQDERHLTLFRVGSICIGGQRELCLVKNVSAGGALIRAYCSLQPDARIDIELNEKQPIPAQVTWVRGSDVGITFDTPVDVLDLLKTSTKGSRTRMPRVEVSCSGYVRAGATVHRVSVHNVSQGGLSVETANALAIGAEVTVTLPGLPPQAATVRWGDSDRYGISFNTVLPLAGLVEWLHQRRGA